LIGDAGAASGADAGPVAGTALPGVTFEAGRAFGRSTTVVRRAEFTAAAEFWSAEITVCKVDDCIGALAGTIGRAGGAAIAPAHVATSNAGAASGAQRATLLSRQGQFVFAMSDKRMVVFIAMPTHFPIVDAPSWF
jgi:hypothetical protein